jgi:hypothetical protein
MCTGVQGCPEIFGPLFAFFYQINGLNCDTFMILLMEFVRESQRCPDRDGLLK